MSKTTKLKKNSDKLDLIENADYCIVTREQTLDLLLLNLNQLCKFGGVYYEVFDKVIIDPKEMLEAEAHPNKRLKMIVLFFEDSWLDLRAEIYHVKARLSNYDCKVDFKCYAEDYFEAFNAR